MLYKILAYSKYNGAAPVPHVGIGSTGNYRLAEGIASDYAKHYGAASIRNIDTGMCEWVVLEDGEIRKIFPN